jgi:hypothetical protein
VLFNTSADTTVLPKEHVDEADDTNETPDINTTEPPIVLPSLTDTPVITALSIKRNDNVPSDIDDPPDPTLKGTTDDIENTGDTQLRLVSLTIVAPTDKPSPNMQVALLPRPVKPTPDTVSNVPPDKGPTDGITDCTTDEGMYAKDSPWAVVPELDTVATTTPGD